MTQRIILLMLLLSSCVGRNNKDVKVSFTLSKHSIKTHYDVTSLVEFHNDIVGVLSNGGIVVLDSSYNRKYEAEKNINSVIDSVSQLFLLNNNIVLMLPNKVIRVFDDAYKPMNSIEKKLASYKLIQGLTYNDTTWFSDGKYVGFLDSAYIFQSKIPIESFLGNHRFIQTTELYKDDSFTIYSCCVGEFGGNLFFMNSITGKTYSYPATCAGNVFRLNGYYYIISSLSHLVYSSELISIKEPSKLYETHVGNPADPNNAFCCNCNNESLYEYYSSKQKREELGINVYYDTTGFITPVTFCYDKKYYSIQIADSCVRIINHDNNSFSVVDTLNVNWRYCAKVNSNNDYISTSYYSSATSLIVIKGNNIDELEY